MSSTNKTSNYNLSQFTGTDTPAWLTDYNGDMEKIDTAVKSVSDKADSGDSRSTTNANAIGTLSNLTTTVKDNLVSAVNEVKVSAETSAVGTSRIADNAVTPEKIDFTDMKMAIPDYTNSTTSTTWQSQKTHTATKKCFIWASVSAWSTRTSTNTSLTITISVNGIAVARQATQSTDPNNNMTLSCNFTGFVKEGDVITYTAVGGDASANVGINYTPLIEFAYTWE